MLLLREQYPINKPCEVLGVPRSSAYYEPRPDEDRPLRDALIEVAGGWKTRSVISEIYAASLVSLDL